MFCHSSCLSVCLVICLFNLSYMYNSIKEKALKEIYGNYTIHLEVQSAAAWNLFLREISCVLDHFAQYLRFLEYCYCVSAKGENKWMCKHCLSFTIADLNYICYFTHSITLILMFMASYSFIEVIWVYIYFCVYLLCIFVCHFNQLLP